MTPGLNNFYPGYFYAGLAEDSVPPIGSFIRNQPDGPAYFLSAFLYNIGGQIFLYRGILKTKVPKMTNEEWMKENTKIGIRVIYKMALREIDLPFYGDEDTADLLTAAVNTRAPVEKMASRYYRNVFRNKKTSNEEHILARNICFYAISNFKLAMGSQYNGK